MYVPDANVPHIQLGPPLPLDKPPHFSLDISGVLGLLGGEDAISAMATVHVYENRRWLGWYNNPGSFQISKHLRAFAKSALSISLYDNPHADPVTLFKSDVTRGPKFRAAHSGTLIEETGHLAALFMKECAAWDSEGRIVPGRKTQPIGITIADLSQAPPLEMLLRRASASPGFLATIPIAISVGACTLCFTYRDWYAASLILMGIVTSGVSCLVLGSIVFAFTHPMPKKGSPAGDGILGSDKDIVLLRGEEGAVNAITRGSFSLRFSSKAHYNLIWWCSFLFLVQCIAQLLLIPQASLFGQITFDISLIASWVYNAWLSSIDKEKMHRMFLFRQVLENPRLSKYTLGTRTSATVFILLVLRPQDPSSLLKELLPGDTKVWKQWKETILERLRYPSDRSFHLGGGAGYLDGFTQQEKDLLAILYEDAQAAYDGYKDYIQANSL